jgi:hypothetical protein
MDSPRRGSSSLRSSITGGYAQYNPHWETRTWNDETAAALKADMEADPGEVRADVDDVPVARRRPRRRALA